MVLKALTYFSRSENGRNESKKLHGDSYELSDVDLFIFF